MKNLFEISIVVLFSSLTAFSQVDKPEHINIKETLNQLFVKTKINSSGNLCITMRNRFNILIDDTKEPIISDSNQNYCIKDSIKITDKHFQLFLLRNKNNYWDVKLNNKPLDGIIKKYEGAIEIKNDSIIDKSDKNQQ